MKTLKDFLLKGQYPYEELRAEAVNIIKENNFEPFLDWFAKKKKPLPYSSLDVVKLFLEYWFNLTEEDLK